MKVYFVRHGQSLGNAERVLLGHCDLDLSPLGVQQAKLTAEAMKDFPIDIIYSSDLLRAFNTAKPHAELRGISVIPDKCFRECYLGDWEGKRAAWCEENYPDEYAVVWRSGFGTFRFPNGEATREAGERFLKRAVEVCRENYGKSVMIVSHAAVLKSFWAIISGLTPEETGDAIDSPTNASYSVCEFDGERLVPLEYSVDGHLASIGITKLLA